MRWLAYSITPSGAPSGTAAAAAAAFALALAGCSAPSGPETGQNEAKQGASESDAEDARARMAMAETAWLSVSREGEVYTTFLDADGRYRDLAGGTLAFTGRWEQRVDGALCFEPDRGEPACWEHDPPQPDGAMRASGPGGRVIELKRIAYRPPPPAEPEGDSGAGAGSDAGSDADNTALRARSAGG